MNFCSVVSWLKHPLDTLQVLSCFSVTGLGIGPGSRGASVCALGPAALEEMPSPCSPGPWVRGCFGGRSLGFLPGCDGRCCVRAREQRAGGFCPQPRLLVCAHLSQQRPGCSFVLTAAAPLGKGHVPCAGLLLKPRRSHGRHVSSWRHFSWNQTTSRDVRVSLKNLRFSECGEVGISRPRTLGARGGGVRFRHPELMRGCTPSALSSLPAGAAWRGPQGRTFPGRPVSPRG